MPERKTTALYSTQEKVCDRCGITLSKSQWNNTKVCYSTSQSKVNGFICIECALITNNRIQKPRIVADEIEDFIKLVAKKATDYMNKPKSDDKTE